ncbi:MAG: hypothetical protein QOF12_1648 [Solirubrobacteraceae bacterium]|nr:hypothetical protein [Solirubrobacteraceae bacterium]
MLARLRPHPHRGDTVAAGVVVLTLFAVVLDGRFSSAWADGVRFVVVALIAAVVIAMAAQSELVDERPRPYQSVLQVAGFVLLLVALSELARVFGANGLGSAGTVVWVGTLLALFSLWFATRRNSAIMTLIGAATGVVVAIAFVDWAFHPHGLTTFRWILLLCALGLTLAAVSQRDIRRRHAVSLVDVVGLTILALGLTVLAQQALAVVAGVFGHRQPFTGGPAGWELVLLAFGFGLIAYGCVDRERVPAFLGVLVLAEFVVEAGQAGRHGASLIGWPIVLAIIAGVLLVIGLRPRQELPPEPPVAPLPPPPPDPPTAPTIVAEP